MFDLDTLDKDTIIKTKARYYVMGMVAAKAEMVQQEIDMAIDIREVIQTCQTGTEEYKAELMEICKEYLYLLREEAAAYEQ